MIKDWLDDYQPKNKVETLQALREIMQAITLAGLYRASFFENAAFYGGTALRIFYGLDRFSEDLDFSLLHPNQSFSFSPFLKAIQEEFKSQGMSVSIKEKKKTQKSNIASAFLKPDTIWKELIIKDTFAQTNLNQPVNIKVKVEVDIDPPLGFKTEEKLLLKPFSLYVICFSLEDLFAGKMHALLFRKWKSNVKGRDWYDLEWYIKKGVPLHLKHFLFRAQKSKDWEKDSMTTSEFMELLNTKIATVDLDIAIKDILRFIPHPGKIAIWSKPYFYDLVKHLKIEPF